MAIAIPVQELHATAEPIPEAGRHEPFNIADNVLSDHCRPAHRNRVGIGKEYCCSDKSCGSAQSTPRMTEQTGPLAELILSAEQDAALGAADPLMSQPPAALDQDERAEARLCVDQLTGDEADSLPAHKYLSPAVKKAAGQQPAPSSLMQRGSNDQQPVPSHQAANYAAGSASDHRLEAGEQDERVASAPSPNEDCKVTAHSMAAILGHSLRQRQSQKAQAVPGAGASTPVSADLASDQPSRLLGPPQLPYHKVMADADTTQQQAVCMTEALCLAGDACILQEEISQALSRINGSGHSSSAATSAHNVHPAQVHASGRLSPTEFTQQVSPSLAPVQPLGGSCTRSQPAAHMCSSAISTEPAGSGRASSPPLGEGWVAASPLEGGVPRRTTVCSPESPPSIHGVLQAAAEKLSRQVDNTGEHLSNTDEGRSDAHGTASPMMQRGSSLRHSREYPGNSADLGPCDRSDHALSSDAPRSDVDAVPQSTQLADNEHLGQTAEVPQENLDSQQLSDTLTCASQQLSIAMYNMYAPSGTADSGQLCPEDPSGLTGCSAVPTERLNPPALGMRACEHVMQADGTLAPLQDQH